MQIKSIAVPRPGFVYLIGSEPYGWYKIGFSKRCEVRVDQIGILLPFKIELFAVWQSFDAYSLECELHASHQRHHIHGEWFSLNEDERSEVVKATLPGARLVFPVGFVHKRKIAASAERDHALPPRSTKWKSDRNRDQKKRIMKWLEKNGLDLNNSEHRRMAWEAEVELKKLQKCAPLDAL